MERQIILDTETTGLLTTAGHRLIEIGCLEMIHRRFTGRHWHYYLNPQRLVDKEAYAIHGLSDEFLKDKPLFKEVVDDFLNFVRGAELIIHNASFDIGFLNHELKLLGRSESIAEYCTVLDTLQLARNQHPGQSNSLDALCRRYQIDNSHRDLHGALIDSKLLGLVYLAMTGGQDQLFSMEINKEPVINLDHSVPIKIVQKQQKLVVIQPTLEELTAHQEFLENMKKNGKCLWEAEVKN